MVDFWFIVFYISNGPKVGEFFIRLVVDIAYYMALTGLAVDIFQ